MPDTEVKIGVAPYPDGSGYRAEAIIDDDGIAIEISYRLPKEDWPELRDAIERALTIWETPKPETM